VYFDHQPEQLLQLAEQAASLGAERFILDDGWFKQRHDDNSGLGDWVVDKTVYPQGLAPLIAHIESLGMEFGLWLEPEMVNPNSDLFREHPDWVLGGGANPPLLARNQLVLNLSLPEVQSYLLGCIQALLTDHRISYLKWDMNRDIHQPMNNNGKAMVHQQTHNLYTLLARIRQQFPHVEIESCASGGARADLGILQFTDRIWVSDNNDALDRLAIQKGFSMFFPAEIMGAHVGAEDCHITGRKINITTRAGVALFGHMGVEANLLALDQAERSSLQAAIALHKRYRRLIHSGDLYRLDTASYAHSFGIVAADKSLALFSYTLLERHNSTLPQPIRLLGIEPDTIYTLTTEWPSDCDPIVPQQSKISGAALMNQGIQMPLLKPQMLVIFSLQKDYKTNRDH
jgi:alpha-galactosidase